VIRGTVLGMSLRVWATPLLLVATSCTPRATRSGASTLPTPSVQVGACGEPEHDGVISPHPTLEHADRDLDGDGRPEIVVVDRAMCTAEHNCFWNVFQAPAAPDRCARYLGTFAASALEALPTRGDDGMRDVRGYWNLHGGRLLLQSYRYVRGGYLLGDAVLCRRERDDRLECADSDR